MNAYSITAPHPLLNFLLLQAAWFVAVLGAAHQLNWPALTAVSAVLLWHCLGASRPLAELKLIGYVTLLGLAIELLNVRLGWMEARGTLAPFLPAPWLVALWSLFATGLNVSLHWLKSHRLGAGLAGAVAGPAAYAGGARLEALAFDHALPALLVLSVCWAVALPLMLWLAGKFNGFAPIASAGRVSP